MILWEYMRDIVLKNYKAASKQTFALFSAFLIKLQTKTKLKKQNHKQNLFNDHIALISVTNNEKQKLKEHMQWKQIELIHEIT